LEARPSFTQTLLLNDVAKTVVFATLRKKPVKLPEIHYQMLRNPIAQHRSKNHVAKGGPAPEAMPESVQLTRIQNFRLRVLGIER
jgi:hypothetical protein